MNLYPDASLIVSAYGQEIGTAVPREWFRSSQTEELVFSGWCSIEVASTLGAKAGAGTLSLDEREQVFDAISDMLRRSAIFIPMEKRHFDRAADLLSRSERPLGGGNTLHLAIAADADATLYTLDRWMAGAGQALGLDVMLLR